MIAGTRQPDLSRVHIAWQKASDQDVLRALNHPDDYHADAFRVVQDEADRRELDARDWQPPQPTIRLLLRRAAHAMARFQGWTRILLAACAGVSIPLLMFALFDLIGPLSFPINALVMIAMSLITTTACSLPLRRTRTVGLAVLVAWSASVIFVWLRYFSPATTPFLVQLSIVGQLALYYGVVWGIPLLILAGAVRTHNHYWPIYPDGFCQSCGYSLRGLTVPRCPECGTPFDESPPPATEADAG
jgi:hypothetical protein